ncbi:connectin-like [Anoplophora glabripennis]|uniref:connectin-like n=1 Tax=Anoplophora glabripennis TaxID=217634 RepID=UPI000874F778|nr:connectin-like [Anoplophora glabripennis]
MKLMIIIAILCLGGASSKESVIKGRNKPKNKIAKPKNLCSLEPSELNNIRCVCTREKFLRASSAECWIFGPVTKEHFIWELIVKTQPYLSDLNIVASNQGYLRDIPQEFVQNMLLLKNFTVSFAVLDRLEKFTFGNSTSLEVLKLSRNQIQHLDAYSISNLPSLRDINLEENRIQTIKLVAFSNVPKLNYVRLNNNNITKIEDRAFSSMSHVLEMDLSENYICDINNLTFFGLSKLKVIDLSFNRITSLASSVFSELWDIEELILDHNLIEFISNRAFDGLRFLKTIYLSNNRLSRFPAGLFTSVFTLFNLDISHNRLETLIFDSIEQLYNNLIHNGTLRLKAEVKPSSKNTQWGKHVIVLHDHMNVMPSSKHSLAVAAAENKGVVIF